MQLLFQNSWYMFLPDRPISYPFSIVVDEDHLINLIIEDVKAQRANETNLCAKESWAVRTTNTGGSG